MTELGLRDVLMVTPIIILLLASIIPITLKVLNNNKELSKTATLAPAFMGLILATAMTHILNTGQAQVIFGGTVVMDGLAAWTSTIVLVVTGAVLLLLKDNPSTPSQQFAEYVFLLLGATIGMLILISAIDLMTVFIGLETMSLALYILIAISNEQKLSKEAAFKYFILGSFASAIFLYGVAFVFGTVGSTSLDQLALNAGELIGSDRLFTFGVLLIVLSFGFKVSLFPFHAWTPDVYQGSPTPMTAYMATAVKAVSLIAFYRFMSTQAIAGSETIIEVLQWLAVGTMFVGNVAALLQDNFKRMLAFSSVSHSGYMMMALIVAAVTTEHATTAGQALVFYLISYSVMTLGAFAIVSLYEKYEESLVSIDDLSGMSQRHPLTAFCLAVFMLSLAGIPPTIGFFAKLSLFSVALAEGFYWMAIWGVVNSVISVYYYLRPIVVMYMKPAKDVEINESASGTHVAIILAAVFILVFGLLSGPIYQLSQQAAM